jgi:uncharacterized protein (TIGR03000 family)
MTRRPFHPYRLAFVLLVCLLLPGTGLAGDRRLSGYSVGVGVGVGPGWNYPGLAGGPYVTYPWGPSFGWPGFIGATGSFWTNGLSLYGPPVPVYGPIPGVFGNDDLVRQWKQHPGIFQFGWVGVYAASPRPKPPTVNVWPVVEQLGPAPPAPSGGCMILSVKVPQPAAEVFVGGVKTAQTGTDRIYESPPLEAGKEYQYELTARWIERGVLMEKTKVVTGKPGEVVRVDFLAPDVVHILK